MQKNKKNSRGTLSVRELKTWLDGYCSAQGSDWAPTPEQWKMILNKILSLNETLPDEEVDDTTQRTKNKKQRVTLPALPPQFGAQTQQFPPQFAPPVAAHEPAPFGGMIGATDRPTVIPGKSGALKTPDKGEAGGPSDFA